ncbi:MAG: hypothetical protein HY756_09950 [Nitrospirae bacterium]|nr:hypothetical protein [Nitrospirota bacterium]
MQGYTAREFIAQYGNHDPAPSSFYFCYSHGCNRSVLISLSKDEWERIRNVVTQGSKDAAAERENIAKAIGMLEAVIGKITGTEVDKGGSFPGSFLSHQLDCADETINTTTYLTMMEKDGVIKFHELGGVASRGFIITGSWPHIAPIIIEKSSGQRYVVDSWFLDNGNPPFILPFDVWKAG